jgi:hypothetical protein
MLLIISFYSIVFGFIFSLINAFSVALLLSIGRKTPKNLAGDEKKSIYSLILTNVIYYPIIESIPLIAIILLFTYLKINMIFTIISIFIIAFVAHKHSNIAGRSFISLFFVAMSCQYYILSENYGLYVSLFAVAIAHSTYNACLLIFPFLFDAYYSLILKMQEKKLR